MLFYQKIRSIGRVVGGSDWVDEGIDCQPSIQSACIISMRSLHYSDIFLQLLSDSPSVLAISLAMKLNTLVLLLICCEYALSIDL